MKSMKPEEVKAAPKSRKTVTISQKVYIPAKPVEVYDMFLNPRKHAQFTGAKATIQRRIGGKFTAWDGYISGTIIEMVPRKKIIEEWQTTEWPSGMEPSILELQFDHDGDGTVVTLTHSKVPATQAKGYEKGWNEFYWEPLKKHFNKPM
jgi:uncharacterized protein YndB with AHSA1/START domain